MARGARPWFAMTDVDRAAASRRRYRVPRLPRDATGAWVPPQWAGAPYRDDTPHPEPDALWAQMATTAPTPRLQQVTTPHAWRAHVRQLELPADRGCWTLEELAWLSTHPAEDVRVVLLLALQEPDSGSSPPSTALRPWRSATSPPLTGAALFGPQPAETRQRLETLLVTAMVEATARVLNAPDGPLWSWSAQLLQIEDGDPAVARAPGEIGRGHFTVHPWLKRRRGDSDRLEAWWCLDGTLPLATPGRGGPTPDARGAADDEDDASIDLTWDTLPASWDLRPWCARVVAWLQRTPLARRDRQALSWHSLSWPVLTAAYAGPFGRRDLAQHVSDGAYALLDLAGNPWVDAATIQAWWRLALDVWGPRHGVTRPDHALSIALAAERLAADPRWAPSRSTCATIVAHLGGLEGWSFDEPLLSLLGAQPHLVDHAPGRALRDLVLEELLSAGRAQDTGRLHLRIQTLLREGRGDLDRAAAVGAPAWLAPWCDALGRLDATDRQRRLRSLMGSRPPQWMGRGWIRESESVLPIAIRLLTPDLAPDQWPPDLVGWLLKADDRTLRELGLELLARRGGMGAEAPPLSSSDV